LHSANTYIKFPFAVTATGSNLSPPPLHASKEIANSSFLPVEFSIS
jgi:hypothetical protein